MTSKKQSSQHVITKMVEIPLFIFGDSIGSIKIYIEDEKKLVPNLVNLLESSIKQIAQFMASCQDPSQISQNLPEVETKVHHSIRHEWQKFLEETAAGEITSVLNSSQFISMDAYEEIKLDQVLVEKIKVQDEIIGELVVKGPKNSNERTRELLHTVTESLGAHLENLRLVNQTQTALAQSDALYTVISELNTARDYDAILQVMVHRTILQHADKSLIMYLFNHAWSEGNIPKWVTPVAQQPVNTLKLNTRLPLSVFEKIPNTLFTTKPVLLENVLEDKRLDWETRVLFHEQMGATSTIIIPLLLGKQSLGFIQGNFGEDRKLSSQELHHLSLITNQVALAVQGMQLLEQTLARARREQLLREVTNRVNNAVGTDEILRQAAEQVGRALKRPVFIYLEDSTGKNLREI